MVVVEVASVAAEVLRSLEAVEEAGAESLEGESAAAGGDALGGGDLRLGRMRVLPAGQHAGTRLGAEGARGCAGCAWRSHLAAAGGSCRWKMVMQ